jgi:L-ascorbate metabolism protein UlaG (beta-lactamase superfamily)
MDPGPLDGGSAAAAAALEGADAILVTHEHWDHVDVDAVSAALAAKPGLTLWTNSSVAAQFRSTLPPSTGGQVHAVSDGDIFDVAGFGIRVFGEDHALIHKDIPLIQNVCFLVDDAVFHPGDSLTVPAATVATLLLPVMAPWLKTGEMIDYYRAVAPERGYAIHDAMLNEAGISLTERWMGIAAQPSGTPLTRLDPGGGVDLRP